MTANERIGEQADASGRLRGTSLTRVFGLQLALVIGVSTGYVVWRGLPDLSTLWGAMYGVVVSLSATLLLWWRDRRAARRQAFLKRLAGRAVFDFYLSAFERLGWVIVMLGLALAMGWFQALPLLAGFVTGQVAAMAASMVSLGD